MITYWIDAETYLKRSIVHTLAHLHNLNDGFLCAQYAQLHNGLIIFLLRAFRAQLQATNKIQLMVEKNNISGLVFEIC